MQSVELEIQDALLNRVADRVSQAIRVRHFGDTAPNSSGVPWTKSSALLAHTGSRAKPSGNNSYKEIEDLNYLWVIEAKGLKTEREVVNLVAEVKSAIRGFRPLQGNFERPFSCDSSEFKGYENGVWRWEIQASVSLIRSPDEVFVENPTEPFVVPDELRFVTGLWGRKAYDDSVEELDRDDIEVDHDGESDNT